MIKITKSATYIVNLPSLESDIKKNEFGIWNYTGSYPKAYKIHRCDGELSFESGISINSTSSNVIFLRRLHCTHPSNVDFKRLICFVSGK